MASAMEHEPAGTHQTKKAAASGWIGSALEYYDFFIYATAASLVFPQIFFPSADPTVAIVASLATYGVGYVARPIGAFVLGHWGDTHGRKTVLLVCMFLMGFSTMAVGLLPTYQQVGMLGPILLVILRLIQGFAVAGEISGASSMILEHAPFGRRGFFASFTLQGVQAGQILAAAVFLPLAAYMPDDAFNAWGWRIPFLRASSSSSPATSFGAKSTKHPPSPRKTSMAQVPKAPIVQAFTAELEGHAPGRLHGADERHSGGRDNLRRGLRGPAGLRDRFRKGRLPVDSGARQHRWPCSSSPSSATFPTRSAAGRRSSSARWLRAPRFRLSLRDQHQERAVRHRHFAS